MQVPELKVSILYATQNDNNRKGVGTGMWDVFVDKLNGGVTPGVWGHVLSYLLKLFHFLLIVRPSYSIPPQIRGPLLLMLHVLLLLQS